MSKWALFAAHRYVRWGSGARTVGPDGRELRKPWRVWSPTVQREGRLLRAARPQPVWPRPLGVLLIGLAVLAVIDAEYPIPTHVQASSAARGPRLMPLRAEHPEGPTEGVPAAFTWQTIEVPPPYTLVVLDEEYAELVRYVDVGGTVWVPPPELQARLGTGGDYHWFVEGTVFDRTVQSQLMPLQIR